MVNKNLITRQKSLFDDEDSDMIYFRQEMKRLRQEEIKEKEKMYLDKYAKEIQVPLSEADAYIQKNIKSYEGIIKQSFGNYLFKN